MLIHRLALRDFRNLAEARLEVAPGFTVLWGHNGAGKTNVLEAVYLVATLRSFRSAELGPLVRHEARAGSIEVTGHDAMLGVDSTLRVELECSGSGEERRVRRTAIADGKVVRSAAQFYGRVRAVLFTPEDLGVLRGAPAGRRQFLDRVLFARERAHIGDVQTYEKLLRSRNRLLREPAPPAEQERLLDTYEAGLAEVGARIWTRRETLLDALAEAFADNFARIHGEVGSLTAPAPQAAPLGALKARLRYAARLGDVPAPERAAALAEASRLRRPEDQRRGTTTVGPHRDDLEVELDGHAAGPFASQGQARALVLAFKLAEVSSARAQFGHPPLLLLDDVSSELDPARSAWLFRTLADDAGQCILTTTAPHFVDLPAHVATRRIRVEKGHLTDPDEGPATGASEPI